MSRTDVGVDINPAPANFEILDCFAYGKMGFSLANLAGASDVCKMYRCLGVGRGRAGIQLHTARASYTASPAYELYSCIGVSNGRADGTNRGPGGILLNGTSTPRYVYAKLDNCAGFGRLGETAGTQRPMGYGGYDANYCKLDATRCYAEGYHGTIRVDAASAFSDCYFRKHASGSDVSGGTDVAGIPQFMPSIPRMLQGSVLDDPIADYSGSLSGEELYDILGNLLTQSIGAEQWISSGYALGLPGFTHTANGGRGVNYVGPVSGGASGLPIFGRGVIR
jgi:hypothetical protein